MVFDILQDYLTNTRSLTKQSFIKGTEIKGQYVLIVLKMSKLDNLNALV